MKNALHLMAKIEHRLLEIFDQYWPLVLIASLVGFLFLWRIIHRLLGRVSVPNDPAPFQRNTKTTPPKSPSASTRVTTSLKRLSPEHYATFFDLYLPRPMMEGTTHLDYVVVSRQGIFVIQLEEGDGRSATSSKYRVRPDSQEGDSLLQKSLRRNDYHINALAHLLQQPQAIFRSVICTAHDGVFSGKHPANVMSSGLGRHITAQPVEPLLTPDLIAQIKSTLETTSKTMDREAERRTHRTAMRRRKAVRSNND